MLCRSRRNTVSPRYQTNFFTRGRIGSKVNHIRYLYFEVVEVVEAITLCDDARTGGGAHVVSCRCQFAAEFDGTVDWCVVLNNVDLWKKS